MTWAVERGVIRSGVPVGSSVCIRRRTAMRQSGLAMKSFAFDCESWPRNGGGSAIGVLV